MLKKILNLCIVLVFLSPSVSTAQDSELNQVGTSMANFLKIHVGSRAAAMGGAFTAVSDDVSSLYWNPAGISFMEEDQVMFQVTNWIADTKHYFFGASYNFADFVKFGISVISFNSGDIAETTIYEPEGTGRTFSTSNMMAGISVSRKFTDRFAAGVTVKYVTETLDRSTASTVAVDIGSVYTTSFLNEMKIGIALSNLGGRMSLDGSDLTVQYLPDNGVKHIPSQLRTEAWDIPLLFRFGLSTYALDMDNYKLLLSSELVDTRDYEYQLSAGGEFSYNNLIFLRGGYKYNYSEADLSFGVGLNFEEVTGLKLKVDYAFNDYGILNQIHSISLLFSY